jgi:two-component system nitrogen regulation sensor histidine kinase GlnL
VAKVVGDHGGVVEFDSEPGMTVFRLMLPAADDPAGNDPAGNDQDQAP